VLRVGLGLKGRRVHLCNLHLLPLVCDTRQNVSHNMAVCNCVFVCVLLCVWCREVETLFHEFGHALQHMMTTVDEGLVAGIR